MVRNSTIPVYSLRRQMLRMSWNKYNLFNTTQRARVPNDSNKTLYQQKWASKKDTRSYHGDQITERQWQSMFKTRLPTANTKVGGVEPHPPVFSLTFAEMERRLDFIVFRSNFAPSIYAARQLVGHGKVTVNGKPVSYLFPCRINERSINCRNGTMGKIGTHFRSDVCQYILTDCSMRQKSRWFYMYIHSWNRESSNLGVTSTGNQHKTPNNFTTLTHSVPSNQFLK